MIVFRKIQYAGISSILRKKGNSTVEESSVTASGGKFNYPEFPDSSN